MDASQPAHSTQQGQGERAPSAEAEAEEQNAARRTKDAPDTFLDLEAPSELSGMGIPSGKAW